MGDAKVSFAVPVEAHLRTDDGWVAVDVRSLEHRPSGELRVTLVLPLDGVRQWDCNHAGLRSDDERVTAFVGQALKRAIGAKVTGILRNIADMTDAIVRGEGPE